MRALLPILPLAVLAACAPDVQSGTYFCGPNADCPPDQVCNADNTCELGTQLSFACKHEQNEPDDTATQAFAMPSLGCVSTPFVDKSCLHDGDTADWLMLTTPTGCTAVEVQARLTFPVAFEPLTLELWDSQTTTMIAAASSMCGANSGIAAGDDGRCLTMPVSTGHAYSIVVKPAGGGDCDGKCAHNNYEVDVSLATP